MRRLIDPVFLAALFAGMSLADIGTIFSIVAALVAILAGAPAAFRSLKWVVKRVESMIK
jgi:hypothetical protein